MRPGVGLRVSYTGTALLPQFSQHVRLAAVRAQQGHSQEPDHRHVRQAAGICPRARALTWHAAVSCVWTAVPCAPRAGGGGGARKLGAGGGPWWLRSGEGWEEGWTCADGWWRVGFLSESCLLGGGGSNQGHSEAQCAPMQTAVGGRSGASRRRGGRWAQTHWRQLN